MAKKRGDRSSEAFLRLLADGSAGGQSKVDALVALSQRTVFVVTHTSGGDDFRTLINSDGQNALPVFTDEDLLVAAATRFGWTGPDGTVFKREVGAREALRHVFAHDLNYLVVDIASEHTMEAERDEIAPLLQTRRSDSIGPYAAHGRISSSMLRAVKPTPPPSARVSVDPPDDLPSGSLQSGSTLTDTGPNTPISVAGVSIHPLPAPPPDALLDSLSEVLRGYPEAEWAAYCVAARDQMDQPIPTIGLRVDASYRARVNDIIGDLREAGSNNGISLDVLLLDDPDLVRAARAEAMIFFPWRRKPGG